MVTAPALPTVPADCRRRLTAHYGPAVGEWLDTVPTLLSASAEDWDLAIGTYHDTGHAAVLTTATDQQGAPLIIKAWPDRNRYRYEVAALRLWYDRSEPASGVLRAADDDRATAALTMVGGRPGGAGRPSASEEYRLVAEALDRLHATGRAAPQAAAAFPPLQDHIAEEVVPRIHRRLAKAGRRHLTDSALPVLVGLREAPRRNTVLHGDLYRENIPFDLDGRPVPLDPLPLNGDAVFDWAFWVVYYELGTHTDHRIRRAITTSGIPLADLLPWCVLLSLDGLLYYAETDDPRLTTMTAVLSALLVRCRRSAR
ncbi:aminoglycoside phosphotransferase family protein [Streptomyces sp. NPDC046805]|uniref:aminoglycoside phosphotransferase family protein n=1 Tax=Streptomyces sp. NPDC046805 TaxID=3155134 RepID=UPI0033CEDDFA